MKLILSEEQTHFQRDNTSIRLGQHRAGFPVQFPNYRDALKHLQINMLPSLS
jgi:hypothetical protein